MNEIICPNCKRALFTIKTLEGRIHQANFTEYYEN
jgi:RNase P subunit RPR2